MVNHVECEQSPLKVFDAIFGNCPDNAVIALGSRRPHPDGGEKIRYLCPVRVGERHELLPGIFDYLVEQTQYFSPNAFSGKVLIEPTETYSLALQEQKSPKYFPVMNDHVSHLCALFVDLDVGRAGDISGGQAIGAAIDAVFRGKLPLPSFGALSGRGAYLLWLLQDGDAPPVHNEDNTELWKRCINALIDRCAGLYLKPDKGAKRRCQWLKRPGTVDAKTGNEVVYLTFGANDISNVPKYSLPGLMASLGIHSIVTAEVQEITTRARETTSTTTKRITWRETKEGKAGNVRKVKPGQGSQPARRRVLEIESLNQYRGGFREGCRHMAAWYYFHSLREYKARTNESPDAYKYAMEQTRKLNDTFKPPLPLSELRDVWTGGPRNIKVSNERIVNDLNITEREARELELSSLCPPSMKRLREMDRERERQTNLKIREEKRRVVDEMIRSGARPCAIVEWCGMHCPDFHITQQYVSDRKQILEKTESLPHSVVPCAPPLSLSL